MGVWQDSLLRNSHQRSWTEHLEQGSAPVVDLTDVAVRHELERRHIALLDEHGMEHLDLHEITSDQRPVTQAIAADLFDRGAGGFRFLSRVDGLPCIALIDCRASLRQVGAAVPLTDPPPEALTQVAGYWGLHLEPAPTVP